MKLFMGGVIGLILTLAAVGCQRASRDQSPSELTVKVPWFDGEKYRLTPLQISTVEDLSSLSGWAAEFLLYPKLEGNRLIGSKPLVKYLRTEHEFVPTDVTSLQLFAVYAYLEKLGIQEQSLGLGQTPHRAKTVAVQAKLLAHGGADKNNVRYSGEYDALLFAPFDRPSLPLIASPGVVAHEFFHSLFQRHVINHIQAGFFGDSALNESARVRGNKPIKPPELDRNNYHAFLYRAVNEGLADVWGWIFSGDPNFVGSTFPELNFRNLKVEEKVSDAELDRLKVDYYANPEGLESLSYYYGNLLARRLYEAYQLSLKGGTEAEARLELMQTIVNSFGSLAKLTVNAKPDAWIELSQVLTEMQKHSIRLSFKEQSKGEVK